MGFVNGNIGSDHKTDIKFVKGVGEKRAELFRKLGVTDLGALFSFYPRTYEDWSHPVTVAEAVNGETCCIRARVITPIDEHMSRSGITLYRFCAEDADGGILYVTVFNNKFITRTVCEGREYLFMGRPEGGLVEKQMSSPEIKRVGYEHIRPVYPSTKGLPSYTIESIMQDALRGMSFPDYLPDGIRNKYGLCPLSEAINLIHFPRTEADIIKARQRLAFDELFIFELALLYKKSRQQSVAGAIIVNDRTEEFTSSLPFSLTNAQKRVIAECVSDMSSGKAMCRVIQGDVGSGKTAVAAALIYNVAVNRGQAVLLAPTEILAEQHFKTLNSFFEGKGISVALITGSVSKKEKTSLKSKLAEGEISVAVGTHALLEDDVTFKSLELIVTDEQHRFGVEQRTKLTKKGYNVHTLFMSATPIPRTMALVIYGDLDVSIIDELPAGRKRIKTVCVTESYRRRAFGFIRSCVAEGRQAYIVCPAVEENENDITSVKEYFVRVSNEDLNGITVGMLHGKMKAADKDKVMNSFASGEIKVLVATTVIEVGIDVPNATVMLIENAERFGLSQLHQLRGRIGRGGYESTCILMTSKSEASIPERLKIICTTNDGMKIADEDLKLRGPGDFLGNRQHGLPEMKIADLAADMPLLKNAVSTANELLRDDPLISAEDHRGIRKRTAELLRSVSGYGYN